MQRPIRPLTPLEQNKRRIQCLSHMYTLSHLGGHSKNHFPTQMLAQLQLHNAFVLPYTHFSGACAPDQWLFFLDVLTVTLSCPVLSFPFRQAFLSNLNMCLLVLPLICFVPLLNA